MKAFFKEFFKRGLLSAWGGPFILAIIYFVIDKTGAAENLSPSEVSLGILSITFMAFIAGGITAIYQNEKFPIAFSALIHATVLYADYLFMYLINDWIPRGGNAIWVFTAFFAIGFCFVWLIIYLCTRRKTDNINKFRKGKN